jgi:putative acetyltransferase
MLIRQFRDEDARALWRVFHWEVHQTAAADYIPEQLDAWAPDSRTTRYHASTDRKEIPT